MKSAIKALVFLLATLPSYSVIRSQESKIHTEDDGFQWKPYYEEGKVGIQLMNGKVVVPPVFYKVSYYVGYLYAQDFSLRECLFDKTGKMILRPDRYLDIGCYTQFKERPIVVKDYATGRGVYDGEGKLLVPCIHDGRIIVSGKPDKTHFFLCYNNNSCLVYNETGKLIIEEGRYNSVTTYTGGEKPRLLFKKNGVGCGVCDENGIELFCVEGADEIESINDESYRIKMCNSEGTVDNKGIWIKKPSPKNDKQPILDLLNRYYTVHDVNGHYGIEDNKGQTIVPCIYDQIYIGSTPMTYFITEKGFNRGLYLSNGQHLIPEEYHTIIVNDDYIKIRRNGKEGLINAKGDTLLSFGKYSQAYYFKKGGFTMVLEDDYYGLIDKNKELLFPTIYEDFGFADDHRTGERFITPKSNNKFGLNKSDGTEIFPPIFDGYDINTDGSFKYILVRSGGVIGVAKRDGSFIITPENFSDIKYENGNFIATHGDELYTIDKNGVILSINNPNKERTQFIEQADDAFTKKKYKDAINYYTQALALKEDAVTYYNRGASYYNNKKYEDAIKDFKSCLSLNPSNSTKKRANELIVDSKERIAKKEQEKAETRQKITSAILGLVVSTVSYAINSSMPSYSTPSANTNYTYYETSSSDFESSFSSSYEPTTTASSPRKCGRCGGKGYIVEYAVAFGLSEKEYCSECGTTMMSNHYHAKCTSCNGTGFQ